MMPATAILEKLAAAATPDRALDAEIAVWIDCWLGHEGARIPRADEHVTPGRWWARFQCGEFLRTALPYTGVAEAALTLIPDGMAALDHLCEHWRIEGHRVIRTGGATCKLVRAIEGTAVKIKGEGATPAIAISHAAVQLIEASS